jgi:HAE1 family hydrophobic/amphiphilic exporter-1
MTMAVSLLVLVATVQMFRTIPKGFLPDEDQGFIFVFTEGAQGISYDSLVEHQLQLNDIVMKLPWVDSFNSTVGGGNANVSQSSNQGRIFIHMVPRNQRGPAVDMVQEIRAKLSVVPGINAYPQILPTIRIGGALTKSQYQFTLQCPDTKELYDAAPKLESKLRSDPRVSGLLQDVASDLQIKNPQIDVKINRDRASTLGITAAGRRCAVYGVRSEADFDDLCSGKYIPRGDRIEAGVPGRPFGFVDALHKIERWPVSAAECGGAILAEPWAADH